MGDDEDGTEFAILHVRSFQEVEEYNQEFRLNGQHGILDWFVGVSAYRSDTAGGVIDTFSEYVGLTNTTNILTALGGGFPPPVTPAPFDQEYRVNSKTESYGVFGDVIIALTDVTNLTVGARYSRDAKSQDIVDLGGPGEFFATQEQLTDADGNLDPSLASLHENWDDLSLRAVLDVQVSDDVLAFFSISQGYKSGGFNSFPLVNNQFDPMTGPVAGFGIALPGQLESFDEEQVINYELGFKSTLMDGRLRLNGSFFYYQYDDLQVQFLDETTGALRTDNIGEAIGQGVDLDALFLATENLTLSANLGWLNTRNEEELPAAGIREGDDLAFAPTLSGGVGVDYLIPLGNVGNLRTNVSYSYTGDSEEDFRQDSFELVNTRITFSSADEVWEVAAWGRNITNEDYIESSFPDAVSGINAVRRNEPATYGVEFIYNFF